MRLFHDLLLLHGYVSDPRVARELAGVPGDEACARPAPAPAPATSTDLPCDRRPARGAGTFGRGVTTLCSASLSLFR